MSSLEYILAGLIVAMGSGIVGHFTGSRGSVREGTCKERREACVELLVTKIEDLARTVDRLDKSVVKLYNNKTVQ